MPAADNVVYLTFDDGPHPQVTPWVLDTLKSYNAQATFFCLGKNVVAHPNIYQRIINEGHAVGNHTYNHVNGWKVSTPVYTNDVTQAMQCIQSSLFRPPYGRIKKAQARAVKSVLGVHTKIIMWDVLSADFDPGLSPEQCLRRVLDHCSAGSIIVFHDSEKAFPNLKVILPEVLAGLHQQGYRFAAIR